MSRPILVTGASGFAGGHLLDLLSQTDTDVVAWHQPDGQPLQSRRTEWAAVNVLDRAAVRSAVQHARPIEVYHFAGAAHVGNAWSDSTSTFEVNVLGTHHLMEAMRDVAPDASVLLPSSALVYASSEHQLREDDPLLPKSPYGLSKLAQELVARSCGRLKGPKVFVARAFNHLGPRQSPSFVASAFAKQVAEIEAGKASPELRVGNLEARRDLTDVRDTVRAYRAILQHGTSDRPYNVCSGEAVSIRELLDRLLTRARVPVRVTVDPLRYRPNDVPLVVGDRSRLQNEVGWQPDIPLDRTLDDLLAFWRTQVFA